MGFTKKHAPQLIIVQWYKINGILTLIYLLCEEHEAGLFFSLVKFNNGQACELVAGSTNPDTIVTEKNLGHFEFLFWYLESFVFLRPETFLTHLRFHFVIQNSEETLGHFLLPF